MTKGHFRDGSVEETDYVGTENQHNINQETIHTKKI